MKKSPRDIDALLEIEHEDAVLSTFMLFVQAAQAVLKYADACLYRKTRLSVSKLVILKALASSSRAMMPSEIAEWTNTERHNITALVGRMKQDGLVTAERNSSDRRVVNIKLTDRGRKVLSQAMPVAREVVNQVMLSITEGDAGLLKEKLRILRQNAHHGLRGFAKGS
jgi:DNA-binding MarR family transcriptional regulator